MLSCYFMLNGVACMARGTATPYSVMGNRNLKRSGIREQAIRQNLFCEGNVTS